MPAWPAPQSMKMAPRGMNLISLRGRGLEIGHLRFQRQKGVATGIPACQTHL